MNASDEMVEMQHVQIDTYYKSKLWGREERKQKKNGCKSFRSDRINFFLLLIQMKIGFDQTTLVVTA